MRRYLFMLFLVCPFFASSQFAVPQLAVPLSVATPINDFKEGHTGNDAFFGIGGELNFPIMKDSPLRVGLSFRYYWMGIKSRSVEVTDSLGSYDVDARVRGSMKPMLVFARFDMMNLYDYPVLPYAGGFIGPNFFSITTITEIDYRDGLEPIEDRDRRGATTVSYGFQAGLHIRVTEAILIDVRWERAYGSETQYLDVNSVQIDDEGYAAYEIRETRTDVDLFTVGVVLEFN